MRKNPEMTCILCGSNHLCEIKSPLPPVSSDDKPLDFEFSFLFCGNCGHVQKKMDDTWKKKVEKIYSSYSLYDITNGRESFIVGQGSGSSRAGFLLDRIAEEFDIPETGKMLDFGCGEGAVLEAFSAKHGKWGLYGYDSNPANKGKVGSISGVKGFFSEEIENIDMDFDFISANYVLEHLFKPAEILRVIREKLSEHGLFSAIVPDYRENFFDLMVLDHCSNFTHGTFSALFNISGFDELKLTGEWIKRAVSALVRKGQKNDIVRSSKIEVVKKDFEKALSWLEKSASTAYDISCKKDRPFGIFGTASAGSWLSGIVDDLEFFTDEDPSRTGTVHLDRPVLAPVDIPSGANVFIGLPYSLSVMIKEKLELRRPDVNFIIPPVPE